MRSTRHACWAVSVAAIAMFAGPALAQVDVGDAFIVVGGAGNAPATQPGQAGFPVAVKVKVNGPAPATQPGQANVDPANGMNGFITNGFITKLVVAPATQPGQLGLPGQAGGNVRMQIQGGANVQVMIGAGGFGGGPAGPAAQTMSMQTPGVGRIDYSSNNGAQALTVADANGKELFSGPVDTPEQKKKVPAEAVFMLRQMVGQRQAIFARRMNAGGPGAPGLAGAAAWNPLAKLLADLSGDGAAGEFSRQVGDYTVRVAIDSAGKHRATVTDADGKPVFDGPVDTPAQWQAIKNVPAAVLAEARKMDANLAKETEAKKAESAKGAASTAPDGR